jgi:hypothetical protein
MLGLATANLINMSEPARIVVLMLDPALAEMLAAPFQLSLHQNTLPPLRGRTPVQFKLSDEARYSQGAAAMVLERLYRLPDPPPRLAAQDITTAA